MRWIFLVLLLAATAGAQRGGTVIITIDDLSTKYTTEEHAQPYAVLNKYDAKAIGFVIPNHAEQYNITHGSDVARELRAQAKGGQEFGLHGYAHMPNEFENKSLHDAYYLIDRGARNFKSAMGFPPEYFKPPFAVESDETKRALSELGILDINDNEFYEYTWYIEREDVEKNLETAKEDYNRLKKKDQTMYLLMHIHALDYGGGPEFLDRFLDYLKKDRANIYPISKYDLLRSGKAEYLAAAEKLSDRLDETRRGGAISGKDPFTNETVTFPAAQGWDIPAEIELYQTTGNGKYFERAKKSADWLIKNQKDGYWERPLNCTDCDRIYTVEGGEAALGLIELYEYTGDEKYLEPAEKWAEFLVNNITYVRTSNSSLIFQYQQPNRHWRVLNINALSSLVLLKLWKHTGREKYLLLANESINFIIENQQEGGKYPYRLDWKSDDAGTRLLEKIYKSMERPYKSTFMRTLMLKMRRAIYHESFTPGEKYDVTIPVQFQDGNYNNYIALRLLQAYEILGDARIKESALSALKWTAMLENPDGSYKSDDSNQEKVAYYSGFGAAAKAQAMQDFTKNMGYLLANQEEGGTFHYSDGKNESYARQETYLLYSITSATKCYLNNCFGYPT